MKKHGVTPAYVGYTSYDMVHVIAEAIERAGGSTDPDKLVDRDGSRPTMSAPSAAFSSMAATTSSPTR